MGVFRSEEILHLKLRMPGNVEDSVKLMDALGRLETDAIEFIDLNKDNIDTKKNFSPMLKRCEDMETKINNFIRFASDFKQKIFPYISYSKFIADISVDQSHRDLNFGSYFDCVENEIIETERRVVDLIDSYQKIKEDLIIELEKKMVYEKFLTITSQEVSANHALLNIMGIIKATDDIKMNRMILRASRGRAFASFFDFEYPQGLSFDFLRDNQIPKKIFIIFYPSDGREVLYKKLLQICDVLSASRYNSPEVNERGDIVQQLDQTIKEKKDYLLQAEGAIINFFHDVSGTENKPAKLELYRLYFRKEKMIYENLNRCLLRENFIDGEVWVVAKYKDTIVNVLNNLSNDENRTKGTFIDLYEDSDIQKPTYIPTTEFLYPFQEIVNTYGIPRYQEINPAYFNVVTFPFLFGVMFGDIGHGLLILLFSLYLCWCHTDIMKSYEPSILKSMVKYRYFFLLLSFFSIFCGFIYNDFLSLPLPFFGTCYVNDMGKMEATKADGCVYPFGMDPKWYVADNILAFFNSLKMKFSVIFGVIHMLFGVILKGANDIHFGDCLGFLFEFIPQFIFMGLLFGYMITMIYIKWSIDWTGKEGEAPSLISQMINIFISKGSVDDKPLWGGKVNEKEYSQERLHFWILLICILLIPIMLLPKPVFEYLRYAKKKQLNNRSGNMLDKSNDDYIHVSQIRVEDSAVEKTFVDFFINQAIGIIEYILGTVSNTASYLRLWALSLAHAQLTEVFFEKTLKENIMDGDYYFGLGFLSIFVGYFILANITFFVLILMDSMECFLHTLRLHWVEFQNKFYKADGYLFIPYNFKYLLESDE